jgi:transposase
MRYDLTDHEWTAIKPFLPNKSRGVPRVNDRRGQQYRRRGGGSSASRRLHTSFARFNEVETSWSGQHNYKFAPINLGSTFERVAWQSLCLEPAPRGEQVL